MAVIAWIVVESWLVQRVAAKRILITWSLAEWRLVRMQGAVGTGHFASFEGKGVA
jgi:hypothetical protein